MRRMTQSNNVPSIKLHLSAFRNCSLSASYFLRCKNSTPTHAHIRIQPSRKNHGASVPGRAGYLMNPATNVIKYVHWSHTHTHTHKHSYTHMHAQSCVCAGHHKHSEDIVSILTCPAGLLTWRTFKSFFIYLGETAIIHYCFNTADHASTTLTYKQILGLGLCVMPCPGWPYMSDSPRVHGKQICTHTNPYMYLHTGQDDESV